MRDYTEFFAGKKVTVLGLGLLGRGVGDIAYIATAGAAEVIVTDLKSEAELASSILKLADYKNIRLVLGEHHHEDFVERDVVVVAPSVPLDSPYIATARQTSARVVQSAALFAELSKIPVIGVTGTRGKSTVTQMIHHVLSVVTGEEVLLGGNIRGVSNLQLLNKLQEDSIAVMELDSWQLQGWGWAEMSPQVAVFTNFMEDHLNYYQREGMTKEEGMERYFADKANIFRFQEDSGVFITTPAVFERAKALPDVTLGQEVVLADASIIPEDAHLVMPGEHNRLNTALAYEALKAINLTDEEIFTALASFPGVEGRLQLVPTESGVKIYNDNNATTPAATAAGISAIATNKNVVLIAGGSDKGLSLEPMLIEIAAYTKQVVLLPGSGSVRLAAEIESVSVSDLTAALEEARLAATDPSDVILFSPGFASFGQYNNEYERNDAFMSLVENI